MGKETALILAGAVAKGAFEAGALQTLAQHATTLSISRIVGASAGALNASIFATGIRMRAETEAADRLVALWEQEATWHNALHFDLRDIFALKGLGTADRVLGLMKKAVAGFDVVAKQPVNLQLVLTALDGSRGDIAGQPATTFESVAGFADEAFDSDPGRERVFTTALASGAFPGVFAPVDLPGIGPCVDGGSVNNTPVKWAIAGGAIQRIIVVTAQPILSSPPAGELGGRSLLSQFADILINERLYRDLRDAESINGYLAKLDQLQESGVPSADLQKVRDVLGWRPLEIIQIRPKSALAGGAFSAFSDAQLRSAYVNAGREAARQVLPQLLGPGA
jgi:NTE family protein